MMGWVHFFCCWISIWFSNTRKAPWLRVKWYHPVLPSSPVGKSGIQKVCYINNENKRFHTILWSPRGQIDSTVGVFQGLLYADNNHHLLREEIHSKTSFSTGISYAVFDHFKCVLMYLRVWGEIHNRDMAPIFQSRQAWKLEERPMI